MERQMIRLEKLEKFYRGVIDLTLNHDTLLCQEADEDNHYAVIYPAKLSSLLEAVDKEWWKIR
jgi:hypothetical protein